MEYAGVLVRLFERLEAFPWFVWLDDLIDINSRIYGEKDPRIAPVLLKHSVMMSCEANMAPGADRTEHGGC